MTKQPERNKAPNEGDDVSDFPDLKPTPPMPQYLHHNEKGQHKKHKHHKKKHSKIAILQKQAEKLAYKIWLKKHMPVIANDTTTTDQLKRTSESKVHQNMTAVPQNDKQLKDKNAIKLNQTEVAQETKNHTLAADKVDQ